MASLSFILKIYLHGTTLSHSINVLTIVVKTETFCERNAVLDNHSSMLVHSRLQSYLALFQGHVTIRNDENGVDLICLWY